MMHLSALKMHGPRACAASAVGLQSFFLFRYFANNGIKLRKRSIESAVLFVAGIAILSHGDHCGRGRRGAETEESPFIGKPVFILHVNFHGLNLALETAALVDRAFLNRIAELEYERRLVRPLTRLQKRAVSRGVDEHVVE